MQQRIYNFQQFYGHLTFDEVWRTRQNCLKGLASYNVRVSILLRRGLQKEDASFNIMPRKYNERYEEQKSTLAVLKIKDMIPETCCGESFETFGDRKTLLGKNM